MISFVKAVQMGIKWIEFDVMLSSCQHVIVFHDESLERTSNGKGNPGQYPYSYLQTLDAGTWFDSSYASERIPRLEDVLELIQNANICANVELKPLPGQDKETAIRTWRSIQAFNPALTSSLLFSSFSIEALKALRMESSDCQIGLLMDHWYSDWQLICDDLSCVSVHVNQDIITPDNAKKIKNTQRALLCYTVNDPFRAQELFSYGVDAVFSDAPDKIIY